LSRRAESIDRGYFDAIYARDLDPWRFATSDYERAKYHASLAALGDRRFAAGLEIGCSIGVLTAQLAARCDRLVAVDVAEAALAEARRTVTAENVAFANVRVPDDGRPNGRRGGSISSCCRRCCIIWRHLTSSGWRPNAARRWPMAG
jgi:hypothetical protein